MADLIPFSCMRPRQDMARSVASLPYDVFSLAEARAEIERNPQSFLRIDMAEAVLPDSVKKHDQVIYETARTQLEEAIENGIYFVDEVPHYYLYRLRTPEGRSQTGIVACASIDDYQNGIIKKHENTRADKEVDRIRHVDVCSAQTGPIFLAFRSDGTVEAVIERVTALGHLYDFEADDGVRHTVWRVEDASDEAILREAFRDTPALYIADGHHRAASAVKAGLLRREQAQATHERIQASRGQHRDARGQSLAAPEPVSSIPVAGSEAGSFPLESDHFLSVVFPSNQLTILDYNRAVTDLNGLTESNFLNRVRERFEVSEPQETPFRPDRKGRFGMYVKGAWYGLSVKDAYQSDDPVLGLDVALLQDNLLGVVLGIEDPRTDKRIDFIGGIRGLKELERRVDDGMAVAFALYPTSIEELFSVADVDLLMPPKSTWFEPKLRSGIFIHRI